MIAENLRIPGRVADIPVQTTGLIIAGTVAGAIVIGHPAFHEISRGKIGNDIAIMSLLVEQPFQIALRHSSLFIELPQPMAFFEHERLLARIPAGLVAVNRIPREIQLIIVLIQCVAPGFGSDRLGLFEEFRRSHKLPPDGGIVIGP